MASGRIPLYECKWIVEIEKTGSMDYSWRACSSDNTGIGQDLHQGNTCETVQGARKNWMSFAELNDLENWEWEGIND